MRRLFGTLIILGLVIGILSPMAVGHPSQYMEPEVVPVFVDVYTSPRNPIGANWDNSIAGDVITVYAEITGADAVRINSQFCNRESCNFNIDMYDMTNVGGNLWMYQLPGDNLNKWPYYEASNSIGSYVKFRIEAEDTIGGDGEYYPGPDETGFVKIYPAWPPQQINATPAASMTDMFVGDTFWVNGTSNYWNSTAHPQDYGTLFPADECNVEIKIGGTSFFEKTDVDGNYAVQVTAPAIAGNYKVKTTVSNSTANRNVPCVADEIDIVVNTHIINAALALNSTTILPEQQLWANGTVEIDGAPAPAGLTVTVLVSETDEYFNVTTDASGNYASQINATNVTGTFTVNITAHCPTFNITAWAEEEFTIVAVPLPDLVVTDDDIEVSDNLVEGQQIHFNVTFFNQGIANAVNATLNITLEGYSGHQFSASDVQTIAEGDNYTLAANWLSVPGTFFINASADPLNVTEESSETNNLASVEFEILEDYDGDGIADINDPDDDGDGTNDTEDAFPLNPDETTDTDGDNIGDNADTDDDNDGVLDIDDAFPLDSNETVDSDGDGIGDNADTDDDNDGVLDSQDAFPLDPTESADYDGDGIGDNADLDDDSDGLDDATDDPSLWDTDNDGLKNDIDNDDDGDGIPDSSDTMPLDTDNDGINNGEDADIDGDGVNNSDDAFPLNPTGAIDTDEDGYPDDLLDAPGWAGTALTEDTDDDNDGVLDADDLDPLDPEISEPEAEAPAAYSSTIGILVFIAAIVIIVILLYVFPISKK